MSPELTPPTDQQLPVQHAATNAAELFGLAQVARQNGNIVGNNIALISKEQAENFNRGLSKLGVIAETPSKEDIHAGIERARSLIATGQAAERLRQEPFIDLEDQRRLYNTSVRNLVQTEEPVYIDPSLIQGVEGFNSWMGRGVEGREQVRDRQTGEVRTSLDAIFDYATRDTQLPGLTGEGELVIILTKEGPVLLATNAHRVAAAKLRNEPIEVTNFNLRATA